MHIYGRPGCCQGQQDNFTWWLLSLVETFSPLPDERFTKKKTIESANSVDKSKLKHSKKKTKKM